MAARFASLAGQLFNNYRARVGILFRYDEHGRFDKPRATPSIPMKVADIPPNPDCSTSFNSWQRPPQSLCRCSVSEPLGIRTAEVVRL